MSANSGWMLDHQKTTHDEELDMFLDYGVHCADAARAVALGKHEEARVATYKGYLVMEQYLSKRQPHLTADDLSDCVPTEAREPGS